MISCHQFSKLYLLLCFILAYICNCKLVLNVICETMCCLMWFVYLHRNGGSGSNGKADYSARKPDKCGQVRHVNIKGQYGVGITCFFSCCSWFKKCKFQCDTCETSCAWPAWLKPMCVASNELPVVEIKGVRATASLTSCDVGVTRGKLKLEKYKTTSRDLKSKV